MLGDLQVQIWNSGICSPEEWGRKILIPAVAAIAQWYNIAGGSIIARDGFTDVETDGKGACPEILELFPGSVSTCPNDHMAGRCRNTALCYLGRRQN